MRILVCGGRDYSNRAILFAMLDKLAPTEICHGAQRGADTLAGEWARSRKISCIPFPADWDKFKKAAGPIRNQRMLDEFKPDLTVAFPGGIGTQNMIKKSRNAKVPVVEVTNEIIE